MLEALPNILAGISAVIALAALYVSGSWAVRRQARPKRELVFSRGSSSLLLVDKGSSVRDLKVSVAGVEVVRPVVTVVNLTQKGWNDIPSSDFDKGRPITISSSSPIIQVVDTSPVKSPLSRSMSFSATEITLGPELVRKGTQVELVVLTDAEADFELDQHILNCRQVILPTSAEPAFRLRKVITYAATVFVIFYVFAKPTDAAMAVNGVFEGVARGADELARFFNDLLFT